MEDEELRESMKDSGLGTPATRAATIERLKQVGYITVSGKKLEIEPKGCSAIELIRGAGVELLASPVMTGQWERRLTQIARGEASDDKFMEQVKQFAAMIVAKVKQQAPAPAGTFQDEERGSSGKKGRAATSGKGARSPGTGRTAKTKRGSTASAGRGGEAAASLAASPPAYSGGVSKPAGFTASLQWSGVQVRWISRYQWSGV